MARLDVTGNSDILVSLYRAMGVLEVFSFNDELTLNEIVEKTALPRTTAFRAIRTFIALDYLSYDPDTRKYTLSPKLFRLGSIAIHARPISRWARPLMERVRNRFGETVYLNIRSGTERMCIESLASTHALQVEMPVGHMSPLYAGATAKILLSGMDDREITQYFDSVTMERLTEVTLVDKEQIWSQIRQIREDGFAISRGERIKGVVSVSVSIFDNSKQVVAALSVLIPAIRAEDETVKQIQEDLIRAGAELSRRLGA